MLTKLLIILFALLVPLSVAAASAPPNIVLIFIDDMGYGDIGPFGNTANQTPNLDRMAEEGNVLRQFYVANTACTPSRAALMTGTYAHRIGMDGDVLFPGEERGLNPDENTIAEVLKATGYATGCFGKWHLGDQPAFLPLAQGFDEYFGIPYSNDMWPGNLKGHRYTKQPYTPLPVIYQNEAVAYVSDGADQSLLCEVFTDKAIEFIKSHKDDPFFCYVPHAYVHHPRFARPEILKRAGGDFARANVQEVDTSVGRILDTLRELKLDKNTLVIFTSDNGGAGGMSMGQLRGGKGGPKYEGHMRVPTIAWWPGTIPAGVETDEIGVTTDLLPTLAKLARTSIPDDQTIDGKDMSGLLLGKPGARSPHDIHYYEIDAIRRGAWKLVRRGKRAELYNLDTDPGEQKNLAGQQPERVAELRALLQAHAKAVMADTRPAGFVKKGTAKPLVSEPGELPKLRQYIGAPDTTASGRPSIKSGPAPPPTSKKMEGSSSARTSENTSTRPNIVVILADDQGWNGLSVPMDPENPASGSSYYQTPSLAKLARDGMRFSRAYSPGPTCSPSRHAIQFGRSPTSLKIFGADRIKAKTIDTNPEDALAHAIKRVDHNYICAHMGKWHIAFKPKALGFDVAVSGEGYNLITNKSKARNNPDAKDPQDPKFIFSLTSRANAFMEEQVKAGRPFFLQISHYADHLSYQALPETVAKYKTLHADKATEYQKDPLWAAMNENLDTGIGMVLDKIDQLGIRDNTYVIYTADNGFEDKDDLGKPVSHRGYYKAYPLRSHKYHVSEGGIRVPFIVRGPGIQAGSHSSEPVVGTDIFPTVLEALDGKEQIPTDVEGGSLLAHLASGGKKPIRRPDPFLVFKFSKPRVPHDVAIIQDDYKLIKDIDTGQIFLFNLKKDPGERHNLAKRESDRAEAMYARMKEYLNRFGWNESRVVN